MRFLSILLWFQLAYSVWQFLRTAKFFRIPYSFISNFFYWFKGYPSPFKRCKFFVLDKNSKFAALSVLPQHKVDRIINDLMMEGSLKLTQDLGKRGNIKEFEIEKGGMRVKYRTNNRFYTNLWYYFEEKPDYVAVESDLLIPGFYIIKPIKTEDILRELVECESPLQIEEGRVLSVFDTEYELNQNFLRLLSIIPLMFQARGLSNASLATSLSIIGVDIFSVFFNKIWQEMKEVIFYAYRINFNKIKSFKRRKYVATFMSTISKRFMYCDFVTRKFKFVGKGERFLIIKRSSVTYDKGVEIIDTCPKGTLDVLSEIKGSDFELFRGKYSESDKVRRYQVLVDNVPVNLDIIELNSPNFDAIISSEDEVISSFQAPYSELAGVLDLFYMIGETGGFPCLSKLGRRAHTADLTYVLSEGGSDSWFVAINNGTRFCIGDPYTLSLGYNECLVYDKLNIDPLLKPIIFAHNKLFFENEPFKGLSVLVQVVKNMSASFIMGCENSKRKRYCSDLCILLNSRNAENGCTSKPLNYVTLKKPSSCLVKLKEDIAKGGNEIVIEREIMPLKTVPYCKRPFLVEKTQNNKQKHKNRSNKPVLPFNQNPIKWGVFKESELKELLRKMKPDKKVAKAMKKEMRNPSFMIKLVSKNENGEYKLFNFPNFFFSPELEEMFRNSFSNSENKTALKTFYRVKREIEILEKHSPGAPLKISVEEVKDRTSVLIKTYKEALMSSVNPMSEIELIIKSLNCDIDDIKSSLEEIEEVDIEEQDAIVPEKVPYRPQQVDPMSFDLDKTMWERKLKIIKKKINSPVIDASNELHFKAIKKIISAMVSSWSDDSIRRYIFAFNENLQSKLDTKGLKEFIIGNLSPQVVCNVGDKFPDFLNFPALTHKEGKGESATPESSSNVKDTREEEEGFVNEFISLNTPTLEKVSEGLSSVRGRIKKIKEKINSSKIVTSRIFSSFDLLGFRLKGIDRMRINKNKDGGTPESSTKKKKPQGLIEKNKVYSRWAEGQFKSEKSGVEVIKPKRKLVSLIKEGKYWTKAVPSVEVPDIDEINQAWSFEEVLRSYDVSERIKKTVMPVGASVEELRKCLKEHLTEWIKNGGKENRDFVKDECQKYLLGKILRINDIKIGPPQL